MFIKASKQGDVVSREIMIRYVCPECSAIGAHSKNSPAPLCHKCDYKVTMKPYIPISQRGGES